LAHARVSEDKDGIKITNQFRNKRGIVYDLKHQADRLTVCITQRENPDDLGEWRVDLSAGSQGEAVITEWGPTKADALRAAGTAWAAQAGSLSLPSFDWDGVAKALSSVRAI
jgi:hypothetical protein